MFKKIYLEITNICNLDCSFCHKTSRSKKFMTKEEFDMLLPRIREHTKYLYFHLMGEPLMHPELAYFLEKASSFGFNCTVATNGFLISRRADEILRNAPYKVTFSLHSFEANEAAVSLEDYINDITDFCKRAERLGTICVLRLWNDGGESSLNEKIIGLLKNEFDFRENRKGFTLSEKIYLESAKKFIWPDKDAPVQSVRFCMGLRDHIGILCDGTVVPCCLDADGQIALGNLFEQELADIIGTETALSIYNGFSQGRTVTELCSRCQYATRFNG